MSWTECSQSLFYWILCCSPALSIYCTSKRCLLWRRTKSGNKSGKSAFASVGQQPVCLHRRFDGGQFREVSEDWDLKSVSPNWIHSLAMMSKSLTASMDFSAPLDLGGHWPCPQPPVSPVCPPAVSHETLSPALWRCAPALWPWAQQCCSLSVPL